MELNSQQAAAQAQFSGQSSQYGKSHQILSQLDDLKALFEHITVSRNAPALDIATGGGHAALFLARMGYEVTASDISDAMLDVAVRLAADEGFSIRTRQHPAEELPYAPKSFAVVCCRVAPHHFADPARFVREATRVLLPGGYFLVIDTTAPDDSPEAARWLDTVEKLRDSSHIRHLFTSEWLALCQKAGLEAVFWRVVPVKQPDLEEHFRRANTPADKREEVYRLIKEASIEVRRSYQLSEENGKVTWMWPRLRLLARKPFEQN